MQGTYYCKACRKLANITEVINLDNSEVNVLSCGHRLHKTAPAVENVPIADQVVRSKHITRNIIEDPQLASSKEIKIEARNLDDKIPVTVSGDNGVRTEGLLDPNFSLQKEGSAYIMNNPIIYATTVNIGTAGTTTTRSTSTNVMSDQRISYNITSIHMKHVIENVDSSPHSTEEKDKIKTMLEELNKGLASKPLPGLLGNLQKNFKDYFPLALPFIQQVVGFYLTGKL